MLMPHRAFTIAAVYQSADTGTMWFSHLNDDFAKLALLFQVAVGVG